MKKMNRKGFMLTETLIVATMLVSVLLVLYIQFKNINTNFNESYSYNSVGASYNLYNVKKYVESNNYSLLAEKLKTNSYIDLTSCLDTYFTSTDYCEILFNKLDIKQVIITNENIFSLLQDNDLDKDFNKYLKKIDYERTDGYRLIASFNDGSYSSIRVLNGYRFAYTIADSCNISKVVTYKVHHIAKNTTAEPSGVELYPDTVGSDVCGSTLYPEVYANDSNSCYRYSASSKEPFSLSLDASNNEASLYYIRESSNLVIHHYLEGTNTEVADDTVISNYCGNTIYTEQYRKNISGYMFLAPENDTVVLSREDTSTILYYREVE